MLIADSHTHIFPDKIAERASLSIGSFYESPMYMPATVKNLLESGSKIGTQKYLVCSSAVTVGQVKTINDFIYSQCQLHPELLGLAAMHPAMTEYKSELDRIEKLGLRGIKFHHDFQQYNIDDEISIPAFKEIANRGLPVLFHMGDNRYDYSSPARLENLLSQVPELTVIAAHFGGYMRWNEVKEMKKHKNVYFDTSSSLSILPKEDALYLIDRFGVDHFMFGTDFPMWNPEEELERFLSLGLDEDSNNKILYNNFMKLFKLEE